MRIVPVAAALVTALAVTAPPVHAQSQTQTPSMAELAAREKERRAKAKAGTKSYTEADLNKGGGGLTVVEDAAKPAAAGDAAKADGTKADPAKKEKSEDEQRAERETAWRDRVTKANAEVARLSARADALQFALNDLSQNLYGSTRQNQAAELEQVQGQLAAARKSVEDLQDEGRRNNYR
jgi:hypothetical protein